MRPAATPACPGVGPMPGAARASRMLAGAAVACAYLLCAGVAGQEDAGDAGTEPVRVDEEVVVRGQTRAALRVQIQLAEEAVYDRFNAINSRDEFDIHCRREVITGSRILRRNCQANFWRNAQAEAGQESTRAFQGGSALSAQQFLAEARYKRRLMAEEMRQLASEDEALRNALVRLANLSQAMDERRLPASFGATASTTQAAEAAPLPYDASLATDVRIGREAWRHRLTHATFALARVYGEIESVRVRCRGRTEQLPYEPGVEWTLPADWTACTLLVEASPSTTFSLYEFD